MNLVIDPPVDCHYFPPCLQLPPYSFHQIAPPVHSSGQFQLTIYFDAKSVKGWIGVVGWPVWYGLPTIVVTYQLQVEHITPKVHYQETDVLPLCHATNLVNVNMYSVN